MRSLKYRAILFALVLSLMVSSAARTEEDPKKVTQRVDTGSIIITSNTLEFDNKRQIVIFTGQVDAKREDFTVNCQKMLLYLNNQPIEGAGGNNEGLRIDKIIATGQVKITRPDGGLAMAEKAIYYEKGQKVVLTGEPIVQQGNDFVEGSTITLFLKEKRSIVEGSGKKKVRAVLFPRSKKR